MILEKMKQAIKQQFDLSTIAYETFIEPLESLSVSEGNNIEIQIRNGSYSELGVLYIRTKYGDFMKNFLHEELKMEGEISLVFRSDKSDYEKLKNFLGMYEVEERLFESNYNRAINADLKLFMQKDDNKQESENVFSIFCFRKGYGITTMLRERQWKAAQSGKNFFYCTSEKFVSYCADLCKHQTEDSIEEVTIEKLFSMPEKLKNFSSIDGIIIDDAEFILNKEHSMEALIYLIRNFKKHHKKVILTIREMDIHSFENTDIGNEILKDLILKGKKRDMREPSDLEKRNYLKYYSKLKSVEIDEEFAFFLAKSNYKTIARTVKIVEYLQNKDIDDVYAFNFDNDLKEIINDRWEIICKKVMENIYVNTKLIQKIKFLRISTVSKNLKTLYIDVENENDIQQMKEKSIDVYFENTISSFFNHHFNVKLVSC